FGSSRPRPRRRPRPVPARVGPRSAAVPSRPVSPICRTSIPASSRRRCRSSSAASEPRPAGAPRRRLPTRVTAPRPPPPGTLTDIPFCSGQVGRRPVPLSWYVSSINLAVGGLGPREAWHGLEAWRGREAGPCREAWRGREAEPCRDGVGLTEPCATGHRRGRSRRPLLHITSHSTAVPVLLRPSRVPPTVTVMGLRPEDLERGAVYGRQWLLENGMHPRHLSSPGMTRVLPTCYTRSEHPADLRRVVLAAQELLGVPSAACGATAAELFGMRLPRRATRA